MAPTLYPTCSEVTDPITVTVVANQAELQMEVSLGASASVISESMYRQLWPPSLQQTSTRIHTYTGEALKILGCISVKDEYNQQVEQLPLLVVSGAGPNLLGKDWMAKLRLHWVQLLHTIQPASTDLEQVSQKHSSIFKDELGLVKNTTTKIYVDAQAKPRFCKARPVPYALRDIDDILSRMP